MLSSSRIADENSLLFRRLKDYSISIAFDPPASSIKGLIILHKATTRLGPTQARLRSGCNNFPMDLFGTEVRNGSARRPRDGLSRTAEELTEAEGLKFQTQKGEKRLKLPTRMLILRPSPPRKRDENINIKLRCWPFRLSLFPFLLRQTVGNLFRPTPPLLPRSLCKYFHGKFSFHFFIGTKDDDGGIKRFETLPRSNWFICADIEMEKKYLNFQLTRGKAFLRHPRSAKRKHFN